MTNDDDKRWFMMVKSRSVVATRSALAVPWLCLVGLQVIPSLPMLRGQCPLAAACGWNMLKCQIVGLKLPRYIPCTWGIPNIMIHNGPRVWWMDIPTARVFFRSAVDLELCVPSAWFCWVLEPTNCYPLKLDFRATTDYWQPVRWLFDYSPITYCWLIVSTSWLLIVRRFLPHIQFFVCCTCNRWAKGSQYRLWTLPLIILWIIPYGRGATGHGAHKHRGCWIMNTWRGSWWLAASGTPHFAPQMAAAWGLGMIAFSYREVEDFFQSTIQKQPSCDFFKR